MVGSGCLVWSITAGGSGDTALHCIAPHSTADGNLPVSYHAMDSMSVCAGVRFPTLAVSHSNTKVGGNRREGWIQNLLVCCCADPRAASLVSSLGFQAAERPSGMVLQVS